MEDIGKQFRTLKSRVYFGDKDSTWPTAVKFNLTPKTGKILEDFDKEMSLTNRKIGTRINYFKCLRTFFFYLSKKKGMKTIGLENLQKEDLIDFFHNINNGEMAPGSVNIHKHVVKTIYKYMSGGEEFPKIVRWIKFERKPRPQLPKNLITEEQIKKLIIYANNPRDKTIISCLAETGARVSELLNVNIDDLEWLFEEHAKIPIVRIRLVDVKSHTGERRIELFDSVPYLQNWLNEHPFRNTPEAPLFICMNNGNFGQRMGRQMVRTIQKGRKKGRSRECYPQSSQFQTQSFDRKGEVHVQIRAGQIWRLHNVEQDG